MGESGGGSLASAALSQWGGVGESGGGDGESIEIPERKIYD